MDTRDPRFEGYRPGTKPFMALQLLYRCGGVPVGDVSGMVKAGFTLLEKRGCVQVKPWLIARPMGGFERRGLAYRWPSFRNFAEQEAFWNWLEVTLGVSEDETN